MPCGINDFAAAATWVWEHRDDPGVKFAIGTHRVTNIKRWQNFTDQDVEVWKFDHGREDSYKILPGQVVRRTCGSLGRTALPLTGIIMGWSQCPGA